jgi:hypothetical protein
MKGHQQKNARLPILIVLLTVIAAPAPAVSIS